MDQYTSVCGTWLHAIAMQAFATANLTFDFSLVLPTNLARIEWKRDQAKNKNLSVILSMTDFDKGCYIEIFRHQ